MQMGPFRTRCARTPVSRGRRVWRGPARRDTAGQVTIKLFGVPNDFARDLGLIGESLRMPGVSRGNPLGAHAAQG